MPTSVFRAAFPVQFNSLRTECLGSHTPSVFIYRAMVITTVFAGIGMTWAHP
ncbi:hypothetical protein PHLCEN_2v6779 [Hermanssonia centrifuga]|uniref:Uncharacterized protein n=1 Tax=Hermanssonia centrifuga TaxID=98765 RepID=A0A2R6NZ25_9APHY|nr:hypothetical protein PHLCEN_2v6779 [Hermanssonia centrifuga]